MFLDKSTFTTVIASTPLVAIDLLVQNPAGEVLLGERRNRPAKGYWFVPGGRVLKNESLESAFLRLTSAELGVAFPMSVATLQGPYEHFYEDSVFEAQASTHYIAIAYRLSVDDPALFERLPREQHHNYRWFSVSDLLTSDAVHANTKAYF